MAETEKKFTLRLPVDMYEALAQMAKEDYRSVHSMVIKILGEATKQWRTTKAAGTDPARTSRS